MLLRKWARVKAQAVASWYLEHCCMRPQNKKDQGLVLQVNARWFTPVPSILKIKPHMSPHPGGHEGTPQEPEYSTKAGSQGWKSPKSAPKQGTGNGYKGCC